MIEKPPAGMVNFHGEIVPIEHKEAWELGHANPTLACPNRLIEYSHYHAKGCTSRRLEDEIKAKHAAARVARKETKEKELIKKYSRGNINLKIGRFVTKEEKDERRQRVLSMRFL